MVPGALSTVMPCFSARPERGRTCASKPGGSAIARPVGTSARAPGVSVSGASAGTRGEQVEPGGARRVGIGRQRQVLAVRQAADGDASIIGLPSRQRLGDARDQARGDLVLAHAPASLDARGA